MKKQSLIILLGIVLNGSILFANPTITYEPQAFISELFFTSDNEWHLEIELWVPDYFLQNGVIDSIVIQSNAGKTRWLGWYITSHQLFLINRWNLQDYLYFSPVQDTITILTYPNLSLVYPCDSVVTHQLVYGYPECEIPYVSTDFSGAWEQSISARERGYGHPLYFYRDNNPTLGYTNDMEDSWAELNGYFYDCNDSIIDYTIWGYSFGLSQNIEFQYDYQYFDNFYEFISVFQFDSDGSYSTNLLSRRDTVKRIGHFEFCFCPYGYYYGASYRCEPFVYNLQIGETQVQEIHLTDTNFIVGMTTFSPPVEESVHILPAPNPFTDRLTFYIDSEPSFKELTIEIYNVKSQLVWDLQLNDISKRSVSVASSELGGPGIYIYAVTGDRNLLKTGQLICQ